MSRLNYTNICQQIIPAFDCILIFYCSKRATVRVWRNDSPRLASPAGRPAPGINWRHMDRKSVSTTYLQHPLGNDFAHIRREIPLHALKVRPVGSVSLLFLQEVLQNAILEEGRIRISTVLLHCGLAAQKVHVHGFSDHVTMTTIIAIIRLLVSSFVRTIRWTYVHVLALLREIERERS